MLMADARTAMPVLPVDANTKCNPKACAVTPKLRTQSKIEHATCLETDMVIWVGAVLMLLRGSDVQTIRLQARQRLGLQRAYA